METKRKDVYLPLSQLQGQIEPFIVDLQEEAGRHRQIQVTQTFPPLPPATALLMISLREAAPEGGWSRLNPIFAFSVVSVTQLLLLGFEQT